MIGVISKIQERQVVEEFFQLFKTPWEFYDPSQRHYKVLLVTSGNIPETDAPLIVIYGTEKCGLDAFEKTDTVMPGSHLLVEGDNVRLPIYEKAITFSNPDRPILYRSKTGETIGYETYKGGRRILRIGYDLFQEILFLLTKGQPPQNALLPTLDRHIAMLRKWIVETGIPLIEIPPVPAGYRFIACLTHDVDFIGIRNHFFDHSMWGFLYRATVGSLVGVVKGKASLQKLKENLKAALSLPLVFFGICRDPWDQFDHCLEVEKGIRSTFFFIPFKDRTGKGFGKKQGRYRAAKYDISDARGIIGKLLAHACEIGVHGIDAWHSVGSGKQELQRIRDETASQDGIGIRMHWLVRNEHSFKILDAAGYFYDSTFGYNETIGFKAGTTQVFKPIDAKDLLEIPLHIQDTALFGHGRLNTSEVRAAGLCQQIIDDVLIHNGVLTILWHQRSLGAERLWGGFYADLIRMVEMGNAWFATANEITKWFLARRAARFMTRKSGAGEIEVVVKPAGKAILPRLVLRNYGPKNRVSIGNHFSSALENYEDTPLDGEPVTLGTSNMATDGL